MDDFKICPYCKTLLISKIMSVNNQAIPYKECWNCKSQFYTRSNYDIAKTIAHKKGKNIDGKIFYYNEKAKLENEILRLHKQKTKKQVSKKISISDYDKSKEKFIVDLPYATIHTNQKYENIGKKQSCKYRKNGYCLFIDAVCNPTSVKCAINDGHQILKKQPTKSTTTNNTEQNITPKIKHYQKKVGVSSIILNSNQKCPYEHHKMQDMEAIVRVGLSDGKIKEMSVPAMYCETCDEYHILKKDYIELKKHGVILCIVEDRTKNNSNIKKNSHYSFSESHIHKLGYNVRVDSDYTFEQRKLILANIIENTNITNYEIKSCIVRCINQHQNQGNYARSVLCWKEDLEFVNQYKKGDMKQVIVNKMIIGSRNI